MSSIRQPGRTAGLGLVVYGLGTTIAFWTLGAPGGGYRSDLVPSYIAPSHLAPAFAIAYVGAISALGLFLFGLGLRLMLPGPGELLWGLSIAAATVSVVGWFVDGGLAVAMAEGGRTVRAGVPHTMVYVVTETGNLLAVCAPAFFVGVAAIVLARRATLPRWLRIFSVVAGVCGILGPAFFTLGVFVLWTLALGLFLMRSGGVTESATAALQGVDAKRG
jgi:hypothetical protein